MSLGNISSATENLETVTKSSALDETKKSLVLLETSKIKLSIYKISEIL